MNIEKIKLENWKIFREPVEISLKNGLNVLYGPNEAGKSTLIDSIRTTFFTKHTSNSKGIKGIKPLGTSLKPQATITFQKNGQEYRITKEFNKGQCILEKLEQDIWQKIAEGDLADQELIQLVGGKLPTGDTKPEFWGIGQTLWMVQGKPIIDEDLNDETLSSLQSMIGAAIVSDQEKLVLNEIRNRFLDTFTEKKKEIRKKSELGKLQEQIEKLSQELAKSDDNVRKKETLIRNLEDNRILLEKNQINLDAATKEKSKLEDLVNQAHEHQRSREKLESEINEIQIDFKSRKEKIDEINTGTDEISEISALNHQIEHKLEPLNAEAGKLNQKIEDNTKAFKSKEKIIDDLQEENSLVRIAHTNIMDEQSLNEKRSRFQEINDLYEQQESLKKEYDSILVPTKPNLKKIENLYQKIRDTENSLKLIGLNTQATAQTKLSGEIFLDRDKAPFNLDEGESKSWSAHQSFRIKIDHIGEIKVQSGSKDVQEMDKTLEKIKTNYQELIAPYPVEDLTELKELTNKKDSIKADLDRIMKDLKKKK